MYEFFELVDDIDCLINNTGIGVFTPLNELEEFDQSE